MILLNKSVSLSSNIYSSAWVMCKQVKYDKNMMTNTLTHMKFYNIFCVGQLSMWKFQNNA